MRIPKKLILSAALSLSSTVNAKTYDSSISLINNLVNYRNSTVREKRPCLIVGLSELKSLLSINAPLSGCHIASEDEPEYSMILETLNNNGETNALPISPIPPQIDIASLMRDIIGKKRGKLTILSSPSTSYLANSLSSIIKSHTALTVDIQIPSRMQDLPRVFKRIDGDAVLVLHDPTIFRNPKQIRSFMELMIASRTPVVGVSPYFKELGGLIEISKPLNTTYQEAIGSDVNDLSSSTIEYWDTIPKIFGLDHILK
ncbi:hypothetical protein [Vibrio alfacsensis]|uniref:hypothetical protein n=1 Tax=Vibrio alfacsensis TaxID=1074311 RepID=UPI00078C127A|nr:hypothetical protein [Vibrio alfacsensis]BAU70876.1 hypothetical protein [Vibrio sp. 04Ya108]BBM67555.1 hypothetical protein VA249_42010 [Vibrio alfacsensis]BCN27037.1 hypothetical protein VYA_42290 [Vibrio alfacsensis]